MRSKMWLSAIVVLIAGGVAHAAGTGQQVELRWKFDEGQRLVYRMSTTSETEMPNNMGVMVSETIMTTAWEVLEVDATGGATVRVANERVQMNLQSPMGSMQADSADEAPPGDPMARTLTGMAGTSYTLVFDADGKIQEVRGLEEMRDQLLEATGGAANPMAGQIFDQIASEEGIKNMMQQGFAAFPDGPVAPGDSWDMSFDMPMPMIGTMTTTSTLTLNRVEQRDASRVAVIDMSSTMVVTPPEDPDSPAAGMMELGDVSANGTMEWDLDGGHLLRSTQVTSTQMLVRSGGQETSMLTVMNMLMELVEG